MRLALFAIVVAGAGVALSMPDGAVPDAPVTERPAGVAVAESAGQGVVIERGVSGHFHATVGINGREVDMLVDTGASAVALTVDDAQRLGIPFDPARFVRVGTGASGPVRGQQLTLAGVTLGERRVHDVPAVVVEGLDRSLLGQSFLRHVAVDMRGDTMRIR